MISRLKGIYLEIRQFFWSLKWNFEPIRIEFSNGPRINAHLIIINASSWLTGKSYFSFTLFRLEFVWKALINLVILNHWAGAYAQSSSFPIVWELSLPLLNLRKKGQLGKAKTSGSDTNT